MFSHFDGQNYGGYQSDETVETPEAKNSRWMRGAVNGRPYCHVTYDVCVVEATKMACICTRTRAEGEDFHSFFDLYLGAAVYLFSPDSQTSQVTVVEICQAAVCWNRQRGK